MTTDEHRDDLRIAQALSALGSIDLGPEPVLEAPSTGRARRRTRTHRRGLFAGFAFAGALAVAIVAVVLHTPAQKPTVAKGTPDASSASTAAALDLEGTLWYLTMIAGAHAQPGGRLRFGTGGTLTGSTGCNDFRGTYAQSGSSLTITIGSRTARRCPPPLDAQEIAVYASLRKAASFSTAFKGVQSLSATDPLTLLDRSGQTLLDYGQGGPETLVRPAWQVTGINTGQPAVNSVVTGAEALTSPITGSTVTATFRPETRTDPAGAYGGTVTGSAGCNSYAAPFQLIGNALTVGRVVVTRKRCEQPAGVMEQEAAFLKALEASVTVVPNSHGLTLTDEVDLRTGEIVVELDLEPVDL
jgi:heat shock protein HslJ